MTYQCNNEFGVHDLSLNVSSSSGRKRLNSVNTTLQLADCSISRSWRLFS